MEKIIKSFFKFLIRLIITPILLVVTVLVLIFYCIIGLIIVPAQTIRFIGLTTLASIQSAFANEDYTNVFLEALYEFYKKYFAFFGQIFYILLAIWIPANENPSQLSDIIKYEWEVLTKNWLWTVLTYLALIISFAITFSFLGLKGLDYLNLGELKQKIYQGWNGEVIQENYNNFNQEKIDSLSKSNVSELNRITKYYENRIDSLNDILESMPASNPNDLKKITELQNQINSLKSKKPQVKTEYKDRIVYRNKPEPFHQYGKGKGKLVITTGCNNEGNLKVWVDGIFWGSLTKSYSSFPGCNATASLKKVVISGKHHVEAKSQNSTWDFYTVVTEDDCNTRYLTCDD
jgi:hypothetical protein